MFVLLCILREVFLLFSFNYETFFKLFCIPYKKYLARSFKILQELATITYKNLGRKFLQDSCKILVRFLKDLTRIMCQGHARNVLKDSYMIHTRIFKGLTRTISQDYDKNT